jgi:hypothetical protein
MTPDQIREGAEHRLATHSTTMAGHLAGHRSPNRRVECWGMSEPITSTSAI